MFILLNGPLGIGKSTLAEVLSEKIEACVMLDGDRLLAANPPPPAGIEHLHSTIALLVRHHRTFGYHRFVINHLWTSPEDVRDLGTRLLEIDPGAEFHCILLTLPEEENLARIERRDSTRAIDELDFELKEVRKEREALQGSEQLGFPFDVSDSPEVLARRLLARLGFK